MKWPWTPKGPTEDELRSAYKWNAWADYMTLYWDEIEAEGSPREKVITARRMNGSMWNLNPAMWRAITARWPEDRRRLR